MSARSTDHVFLGSVIPKNYKASIRARAIQEDRSMSSVIRSALSLYLYGQFEQQNGKQRND
jgi:hypothetical protein